MYCDDDEGIFLDLNKLCVDLELCGGVTVSPDLHTANNDSLKIDGNLYSVDLIMLALGDL